MTKRSDDAEISRESTDAGEITPVEDTHASAPATTSDHDTAEPAGRRRGSGSPAAYPDSAGGRLGSAWVALVLGALVTILLLVFIVQNSDSAEVQYFGWTFMLPLGVLVLLAAISGALIMALFAGVRILQLRMRAHKARKLVARQG